MKKLVIIIILVVLLQSVLPAQTLDTIPCGQRQRNYYYTEWYDTTQWYLNPDNPLCTLRHPNYVYFHNYGNFDISTTFPLPYIVTQQYAPVPIRAKGVWFMVSPEPSTRSLDDNLPCTPYPRLSDSKQPEYAYLYLRNPEVEYYDTSHYWSNYLIRIATARWDTLQPKVICLQRTADGRYHNAYCYLYEVLFDTVHTLDGEFWIGGSTNSNDEGNSAEQYGHYYNYLPTFYLSWGLSGDFGHNNPYRRWTYGQSPDGPWGDWNRRYGSYGPFGIIVDDQRLVEVASCDTAQGVGLYTAYYPDSTFQTISAVPNRGYRFTHWDDGDTANPRTVFVTQDTVFTACFEPLPLYSVTLSSNDPDLGTVAGDSSYYAGDEAIVEALPVDGVSHFAHWNDGDSANPRRIVVVCDTAFTAFFVRDTTGDTVGIGTLSGRDSDGFFTLTPNPAHSEVTVAVGGAWPEGGEQWTAVLTDASGREVLRKTLGMGPAKFTLQLKGLASGVYYVTIANTAHSATRRLVVGE